MKKLFFSIMLLATVSLQAQDNGIFNTEKYLKGKFSNPDSPGSIRQPLFFQTPKADTIGNSFAPGNLQIFTLANGDRIEYGIGKIPTVIPDQSKLQGHIPNIAKRDEGQQELFQQQIPNVAPKKPQTLPRMKIIPKGNQ